MRSSHTSLSHVGQLEWRAWKSRNGFSAELPQGIFQTFEALTSCFLKPCHSLVREASDHAKSQQMVRVGKLVSWPAGCALLIDLQGCLWLFRNVGPFLISRTPPPLTIGLPEEQKLGVLNEAPPVLRAPGGLWLYSQKERPGFGPIFLGPQNQNTLNRTFLTIARS